MSYIVTRLEREGERTVSVSSTVVPYFELWRAQNKAEQLARAHRSFGFDQESACWEGSDDDGPTFRYAAVQA